MLDIHTSPLTHHGAMCLTQAKLQCHMGLSGFQTHFEQFLCFYRPMALKHPYALGIWSAGQASKMSICF